jgi:hypothetical protein
MRTLLLVTLITLFGCFNFDAVQAQAESDSTLEKSFLFQIGSNFKPTNFNGATFAYQKKVDPQTSNRFYFQLNGNYTTDDQNRDIHIDNFSQPGSDTVIVDQVDEVDSDDVSIDFTVGAIRIKYQPFNENIRYYGGVGIAIDYSFSHFNRSIDADNTQQRTGTSLVEANIKQERDASAHVFGIGPLLITGAEYYLTDNLFLLAEYGLQVRYERSFQDSQLSEQTIQNGSMTSDELESDERTTNSVIIDSFPVRFGLRVNF